MQNLFILTLLRITIGASAIYLAMNFQKFSIKIGGQNDPEQIEFVTKTIQNQIYIYVEPSDTIQENQIINTVKNMEIVK